MYSAGPIRPYILSLRDSRSMGGVKGNSRSTELAPTMSLALLWVLRLKKIQWVLERLGSNTSNHIRVEVKVNKQSTQGVMQQCVACLRCAMHSVFGGRIVAERKSSGRYSG